MSGKWVAAEDVSPLPTDGQSAAHTNRLIRSYDPYLLLHAHNPVDWYPWGPEALETARREDKPIFLSIGYSTCYWCHVAEREIYSNPVIAKLMNQWFVNIKVDREQRPDVDRVYMLATQLLTDGGGWPNNVFLTPDLKPFYAGSYFPPQDQGGRPGFPRVLETIHEAWMGDRTKVVATADQVYRVLQQTQAGVADAGSVSLVPQQWIEKAMHDAGDSFDESNGGFGKRGTQFPQSPLLTMLMTASARDHDAKVLDMATQTLQAMTEGGVMDQLAAGFFRYSTEPSWSLPHFEKMLYDNAQLLALYAQAYAVTQAPLFQQVALRTAHYLTSAMQASEGGFYSAQDAEVDGVEGASYVWARAQIESVLGADDAKRWFALYTLTPMPENSADQKQSENGVLRLARDQSQALAKNNQLASAIEALRPLREKLLAVREQRPQPARDEKIVTADNALAIIGFAEAGEVLHDPTLIQIAVRTADRIWSQAFDAQTSTLKHQFFRGHSGDDGFLDDYALLGRAFLTLHRNPGGAEWLSHALLLAAAMLHSFARPDGRLVATWDKTSLLVAPPAEGDSVKPSGESAAIVLLLELADVTGDDRYAVAARGALAPLAAQIAAQPSDWGALLTPLGQPRLLAALEKTSSEDHALTQRLPDSGNYVHTRGHFDLVEGGADLIVTIEVDRNYHINANPASDPYLVPTALSLDGYPKLKVDYPVAQIFKALFAPQGIAVYQDQITLRAHLGQVPAPWPQRASLRVQACNDQYCLAPATVDVPLSPAS
jgi:uncharacterized protein YyaL (SSP411 family)